MFHHRQASAIGAITMTAVGSNLHSWNGGSPTQEAVAVYSEKFRTRTSVGFVIPSSGRLLPLHEEITTPIRIGIIRNIPTPQMLKRENNSSKCDQKQDPVLGCVADCRRCKAKTNTDNNRTSYKPEADNA